MSLTTHSHSVIRPKLALEMLTLADSVPLLGHYYGNHYLFPNKSIKAPTRVNNYEALKR